SRVRAEHPTEHFILIADFLVHRIRELIRTVIASVMITASGKHHQFFRMFDGQRLQNKLVDQRENSSVRADTQSQREQGNSQEYRGLAQTAQRIAEVLQ